MSTRRKKNRTGGRIVQHVSRLLGKCGDRACRDEHPGRGLRAPNTPMNRICWHLALIWQFFSAIVFLLLVGLLSWFAWPTIAAALDERGA